MIQGSYNNFFKWLKYQCEQHTLLLHEDIDMKKVFFTADIEQAEAFTNTQIKPQEYCVVAMFPDLKGDTQSNQIATKFLVFFGHFSNTNNDDLNIQNALVKSEQLYYDFVERMNGDEILQGYFLAAGGANVNAKPRQNFYKDYSGWICEFNLAHQISLCSDPAQNPRITQIWTDNGNTPSTIFQ